MLHKTHLLTISASLACLTTGIEAQSSVVGWGAQDFDSAKVLAPYVQLAAGTNHALGLRADGSVQTWGDHSSGQGEAPALPPGLTYVELSAGGGGSFGIPMGPAYFYGFSVARRNDGSVVAWGDNTSG